jgi:hypothetical protein
MDTPVDATVRITPLSLLWTSFIGTAVLSSLVLTAGLWWGGGASASSPLALGAGGGALLLAVFAVGYRRHGRPVPTTARIEDARLVVGVPAAWGTLIREELRLTVSSARAPDAGLVVRGAAAEWWDPGRYEVRIPPTAADALTRRLPDLN